MENLTPLQIAIGTAASVFAAVVTFMTWLVRHLVTVTLPKMQDRYLKSLETRDAQFIEALSEERDFFRKEREEDRRLLREIAEENRHARPFR